MVDLEGAKKIMIEKGRKYNRVQEYTKCFVFWYDDESGKIRDGGVGSPIGVVKENGEVLPKMALIADDKLGEKVGDKMVLE